MTIVKLPPLGENITKATVSFWFVHEGKTVKENEDLVELTTDKAAFNVPSPCAGIVGKIFKRVGDSVRVDEELLEINES